jgi:serine/threonine protein kinase
LNSSISILPTTKSLSKLIILNDFQIKKEKAEKRKIRILTVTSICVAIGGLGLVAGGATLQASANNTLKSQLLIIAGLVTTIAGIISLVYLKNFSKPNIAPSLIGRVLDVQTSHVDKLNLLITLTSICKFIEQHQVEWKQYVQSTNAPLHIPSSKMLLRTVQYNPDHTIFIHFNQKKKFDLCIGKGSFKTVTLALNFFTCEWMASASVKLKNARPEILGYQVAQQYQIKYIIQAQYMISYEKRKISASGPDETIKKVRLISPYYVKKDLLHAINNNLRSDPKSTWTEKIQITRQLIEGVTNLHEKGYLHRDLKPENIFLGENELCIGDLGSLCKIDDNTEKMNHRTTLYYASADYVLALKNLKEITKKFELAKEVYEKRKMEYNDCLAEHQEIDSKRLQGSPLSNSTSKALQEAHSQYKAADKAYNELKENGGKAEKAFVASVTEKLDVWSLGCILYELFSGHNLPWANLPSENDIFNVIINLPEYWVPEVQNNPMTTLVSKMLCTNPKKRISSRELREKLTTLPILNGL